jgi:hypothetical protein
MTLTGAGREAAGAEIEGPGDAGGKRRQKRGKAGVVQGGKEKARDGQGGPEAAKGREILRDRQKSRQRGRVMEGEKV